jgi:hypothetical protein
VIRRDVFSLLPQDQESLGRFVLFLNAHFALFDEEIENTTKHVLSTISRHAKIKKIV